jgi:predicted ATPase
MLASQYVERVSLRRELVESFERYPFDLPVLRGFERLDLHPRVTFLVGENGSGKSTLLEAIAVALGFNAEGGSRNFNFATRATHSELHAFLRVARGWRKPRDHYFLRAESFYNVATEIEDLDAEPAPSPPIKESYGGKSLHERSHGEAFMALLMNRFGGQGLYLLDEPEAALSPARQLAVLQRLHDLVVQDSQFIIATHSPILMAYPDAAIVQCGPEGLVPVAYEDTEHYQVTRRFLANRQVALDIIMGTSRPHS